MNIHRYFRYEKRQQQNWWDLYQYAVKLAECSTVPVATFFKVFVDFVVFSVFVSGCHYIETFVIETRY